MAREYESSSSKSQSLRVTYGYRTKHILDVQSVRMDILREVGRESSGSKGGQDGQRGRANCNVGARFGGQEGQDSWRRVLHCWT